MLLHQEEDMLKTGQVTSYEKLADGLYLNQAFLSEQESQVILKQIRDHQREADIFRICRPMQRRWIDYSVIDGNQIKSCLPEIWNLYQRINQQVNLITGENLIPFKDERLGCNISIITAGGSFRWHYDRNVFTAVLYLNQVEGGETECYPNYRILLPDFFYSGWQRLLDGLLELGIVRWLSGKRILVKPQVGSLLIIPGKRCLHSVCPVTGAGDRIAIVMAYDYPEANPKNNSDLHEYLYNQAATIKSDPNYS